MHTTDRNATAREERLTEVRRIAEAEHGEIVFLDPDATFFRVRHEVEALIEGAPGRASVVTNFEWTEARFEGF